MGQALFDIVGQGGVGKHLLVGDENLANGFVAALHQRLQFTAHDRQGVAQLLPLLRARLATQG